MITRRRWRWFMIGSGVGLSLLGAGFLGGVAAERIRFDRDRTAGLGRYEAATPRGRAHLMELEGRDAARGAGAWSGALRRADEALARGDAAAARRAVAEAYNLAFTARRWEGLLDVGDAYRRTGTLTGVRGAHASDARRAYLAALLLAQRFGSIDGTLAAAEAFDRLGDREVVEQTLHMAERLAAATPNDPAVERVRGFAARRQSELVVADEVATPF